MLEERMLTTAYPLLLRLMNEYGHSIITFKLDNCITSTSFTSLQTISIDIRSTGRLEIFIPNYSSSSMAEVSIGSGIKKCPVLNFLTSSSFSGKGNVYIKYCAEIINELEKYKKLEDEAAKVMERLDKFNMPLTRHVLIEKV